ncbi:MAG: hypothetical protein JXA42_00990, partial [Anaerolineales bacterium]|nr:hypothetical protein [Anaerolineales bacterium]
IPYIMGANITTFIDTLLAAVLLDNPATFTIVLTAMVSTALVSIAILAACYRRHQQVMLDGITWITGRNRNLALFLAVIFIIPIVLISV